MTKQSLLSMTIFINLFAFAICVNDLYAQSACNYYASPNGTGNGLTQSSPFRIKAFWNLAKPGKTLCLLDGSYTDPLAPPSGVNGTSSGRITIRALHDGKVIFNGRGIGVPVVLKNNDYFLLEGFNASNGSTAVIQLATGADYNIIRRVCAWNASDSLNSTVWGISGNHHNILEDVCGFGNGRKIFSNSQGGNNLVIRRAWGRWERSLNTAGKSTFSNGYNGLNSTYENVVGTWNEAPMQGKSVSQPTAILRFGPTTNGSSHCQNNQYLGSIAYIKADDKAGKMQALASSSDDNYCLTHKNNIVYIAPGTHTNLKPFALPNDSKGSNKYLTNTTEIASANSTVASQWKASNRIDTTTVNAAPNVWTGAGTAGARVCKRYVNGSLTSQPLWPWPMNQRIIDAMKSAGKSPVDVTRTMEELFGKIPSECRSGSSSTSSVAANSSTVVPASPINLVIE